MTPNSSMITLLYPYNFWARRRRSLSAIWRISTAFLLTLSWRGDNRRGQNWLNTTPRSVMSNIEREECQLVLQIIKQITIEGYYTSIMFELQSMDRLGKGVVRSLAARSRRQPENEMLGPFHRRILRFGRRAREISRPGG